MDALNQALRAHWRHLQATAKLEKKRAAQHLEWGIGEIRHEVGQRGLAALGGVEGVRAAWNRQPAHWSVVRKLTALLERAQ